MCVNSWRNTRRTARSPHADEFGYVGHSNGTYILASALQNYKSLKVERVYSAGSLVPQNYAWRKLADRGRVSHVVNVVAASDWVVALFPHFFEQLAEWFGVRSEGGFWDIGSAGFRGFHDAMDAQKRVEKIQFAKGGHSTDVGPDNEKKLKAIAFYIVFDDRTGLPIFQDYDKPENWLNSLSNISWLVGWRLEDFPVT